MKLVVDFDGTCTTAESGIEIAKVIGRGREAELSCSNLLKECDRSLDRESTAHEYEEAVESLCSYHLKEGASWLRGYPATILSEVKCPPSANTKEIMKRIKENGGVNLISRTDRRLAENFLDQFEETRYNREILCNELAVDEKGNFTGTFSSLISKGQCYTVGDVVGDSPLDIGLYRRAHKQGYKIYLAENGEKTTLAKKALKKFEIPFIPFS